MITPWLSRLSFRAHLQKVYRLLVLFALFGMAQSASADDPVGCVLNVVNGAANNCYTVTPPTGTIMIDGQLIGAEWDGAPSKDLNTAGFRAKVRFKRMGNSLYFLISVDDSVLNNGDRIELNFDPLHNHGLTADDVKFVIKRNGSDHRKITNNGATDVAWVPGGNLSIKDASGSGGTVCSGACVIPDFPTGWSAEVAITAGDVGAPDLPAILGFALLVNNQDTSDQTTWPDPFPATPATWANLKTRYPIKYMVVLDQSGSMLAVDASGQSKWDYAKKAANFLANAMAILRDAIYFDDKIGVVTFSWNNSANVDRTTTPKPLASVGAFPLGNYTDTRPAVADPLSDYYTPIGKGLNAAFTNLGTGVEETQRVVLFLSDGLHNRPTTDVPLLPTVAHVGYNPCGLAAWEVCTSSLVQVNTVALGQDSGVDTALLTNIKNAFQPDSANQFASTYNITTNVEDLKETFISSLDSLYQMNLAASGPSGTEFTVNTGERKLIVIQSWTNPASATTVSLQRKAAAADPFSNVACSSASVSDTSVGFGVCIVNDPQSGIWRALDGAGNPLTANRQFVLVDLNLRARFSIDQKVHGTSQDIILTADLNEAGVPVTHDPIKHPVKVTVSIKRPGESFGTLVSTFDGQTCEPRAPQLPPIVPIVGISTDFAEPSQVTVSDLKPPRFTKIDALFKLCNKSELIFVEDPGIELFDDGTHGDVKANDGIYTLQFTNTKFEGSYVFRFRANGVSPSGSTFSRVKTVAEYVRVEVVPNLTVFGSRNVQQNGTILIREYFIIPRNFVSYLGPGFSDQIKFTASAGSFVGPVIDYNNGIYSQLLSFNLSTESPVVTATVQGKPVSPPSARSICLQDDDSGDTLRFDPFTGDYIFIKCGPDGYTQTGKGQVERVGCRIKLRDANVSAEVDQCIIAPLNRGTATVRRGPLGPSTAITDRDVTNNTCACR